MEKIVREIQEKNLHFFDWQIPTKTNRVCIRKAKNTTSISEYSPIIAEGYSKN